MDDGLRQMRVHRKQALSHILHPNGQVGDNPNHGQVGGSMAMAIQGNCHTCHKVVVVLRLIDEQVVLVVGCDDCREEVHFPLQAMIDAMHNHTQTLDEMLDEFHPTGKPN